MANVVDDRHSKFAYTRRLVGAWCSTPGRENASLLDIGCRDCILRRYLPASLAYEGLDLFQNATGTVQHVGRFPDGVNLPERSRDITCALDVLEHMDDMQLGLEAMLRVTRHLAIVVLPNMAHLEFRLRFLRSGRVSGKYDLAPDAGPDRHRWLTTVRQSDAFMRTIAARHGFACTVQHLTEWRKQRLESYAMRACLLGPNWWAWSSLYRLERSA